jgi:micrococcal nuclease
MILAGMKTMKTVSRRGAGHAWSLACLAGLLLATHLFPAEEALIREPARVVRIISGDTLTILYQGKWQELRLIGIDAPEPALNNAVYEDALRRAKTTGQVMADAREAIHFLRRYVRYGSQIFLEFDVQRLDRFGRLLAYAYLTNGKMINELVLNEGYASWLPIPPNLKYQERLGRAYRLALSQKKGIWSPRRI